MDLEINGRTALVCAGGKGLGFACASGLAAEGVNIVLNGRDPKSLEQAANDLSRSFSVDIQPCAADLSVTADLDRLIDACPNPDILINNGGGPALGSLKDWSDADWETAIATNLRAPASLIRAFIDGMKSRKFGRIINITSNTLRHPMERFGLSVSVRSGLHGLSDVSAFGTN